jgi:hypothetical protein
MGKPPSSWHDVILQRIRFLVPMCLLDNSLHLEKLCRYGAFLASAFCTFLREQNSVRCILGTWGLVVSHQRQGRVKTSKAVYIKTSL